MEIFSSYIGGNICEKACFSTNHDIFASNASFLNCVHIISNFINYLKFHIPFIEHLGITPHWKLEIDIIIIIIQTYKFFTSLTKVQKVALIVSWPLRCVSMVTSASIPPSVDGFAIFLLAASSRHYTLRKRFDTGLMQVKYVWTNRS